MSNLPFTYAPEPRPPSTRYGALLGLLFDAAEGVGCLGAAAGVVIVLLALLT